MPKHEIPALAYGDEVVLMRSAVERYDEVRAANPALAGQFWAQVRHRVFEGYSDEAFEALGHEADQIDAMIDKELEEILDHGN